ncbi:lactate 2-monooxygenase [Paraconexibacter algicola]|uniref:Alpha-hydroxy-acid oxidizing enzyme n=1 Tax=Paraconexibacter algicola TaxID=2133960 RepID=A0A2T4UEU8_9ACTN|nr:lactate 2-monooxygenase [Paraconexibacter algicola]PTL56306.1 alpha-hydroxy-acid oxidizing enzyme [Paraconexibacter algicola]
MSSPEIPFANYQYEIYLRGSMMNQRPRRPLDWQRLEEQAAATLARGPWGYIAGGAGRGDTMRANQAAFDRWALSPRMLRDVAQRSTARTVLGTPLPAPVLLAPIGVQTLAHPDGELATARASARTGVPLVTSSASSFTFEEIAEASGDTPRWYQLYWPKDRTIATSFIRRAEAAGYSALVVTLDTWLLGWRPMDLDEGFLPFLWGEGNVNYLQDPAFRALLAAPPEEDMQAAIGQFAFQFSNPAVTWEDLAFLRETTELPIVLKGILRADDARLAAEHGVDGVIVSNHGGRQVDGAIGALAALPEVVDAVGDRLEVLFDSGIRGGSDALKALALGARAVLLGRPYMWGLATGGEDGVVDVVRSLLAELDLAMALTGHRTIDDVDRSALVATP